MRKRALFLFIALCLLLTALSATALATDDGTDMTGDAFLATAQNGIITLNQNINLTSTVTITEDLIINLNGYTLSRNSTDPQSLGILMLDINGGSVIIQGPGTVTGGNYTGEISFFSPKGVIDVAGSASLTVKAGAMIKGGKIESNSTIGDFDTIKFASSGMLTIEDSTVVGLDYGNRDAGNAVYVSGTATVVVTRSNLTGGSSTSNTAGNALELRTSGNVAAQITNSILTGGANEKSRSGGDGLYVSSGASAFVSGGAITGGQGNSGGKGVNVSGSVKLDNVVVTGGASTNSTPGVGVYCTSPAKTVIITGSTVTGGSPALGTTTNSAGRGMEIYGPVVLTVENSAISGGDNNRTGGDAIGGNAIWFYNENAANAEISLTNVSLGIGNEAAGNAVIAGNYNAPAGSGGMLANITASGTMTVNSGTLKNTTVTPGETGLTIEAEDGATANVGQNNFTVVSGATVSTEEQTTSYFPTATAALANAGPGATVTITNVGLDESLDSIPEGVIVKNQTGEAIVIGGETVENGGETANYEAKIEGKDKYISLEDAFDAAEDGDTITLLANVHLSEPLSTGDDITLDLAGCTVTAAEEKHVLLVSAGTLTLKDSSMTNAGKLTGGIGSNARGGGVTVQNGATFIMEGGTITGNDGGTQSAGGVHLHNNATFIMKGGVITGNRSGYYYGGVYAGGGSVRVSGLVTITGNKGIDGGTEIDSNLWLDTLNDGFLQVGEEGLAENAKVGIYINSSRFEDYKAFTYPYGAGKVSVGNFSSDRSEFAVKEVDAADGLKQLAMARPQIEKPVASIASGAYTGVQTVALSTTTEGAIIYYTTDGSDPRTSSTRQMYTETLVIYMDTVIKAYAEKTGFLQSDVAEFIYTISLFPTDTTPIEPAPTYPPVIEQLGNGEISVSPRFPVEGDEVIITPVPGAGFIVKDVIVTDRNGHELMVRSLGNDTYAFQQPESNVTITVTFQAVSQEIDVPEEDTENCSGGLDCPSWLFTDIDVDAWYHEAVDYVVNNALMVGTSNTTFAPNETTTRAMILTILWRIEGSPVVNYAMDFSDVSTEAWYTEAVRWAAANNIIEGYDNGTFGPNDAITREQMVSILYRYYMYKGYDLSESVGLDGFTDASEVSAYAVSALEWACGVNLIQGDGLTLSPNGNATRSQVAVVFMRFCEMITK